MFNTALPPVRSIRWPALIRRISKALLCLKTPLPLLCVIDGVPVNSGNVQYSTTSSTLNPLASIDTENIESITVLKDASSTALYGARGANGVIVVKTKRGKQGKTQFNATITHGYNNNATPGPTMLTPA